MNRKSLAVKQQIDKDVWEIIIDQFWKKVDSSVAFRLRGDLSHDIQSQSWNQVGLPILHEIKEVPT